MEQESPDTIKREQLIDLICTKIDRCILTEEDITFLRKQALKIITTK